MAGNKVNVKIQRNKTRSSASVSPAQSQLSDDANNTLPDLSILRKSIATSVTGFAQARDVFDTGTHEIKQLLSNECDIIYECRVCRNLFRSLANFISHKRIYCRDTFKSSIHPHFNNNNFMNDDIISIIEHEEEYQDFIKNKKINYKNGISVDSLGKRNTPKDLTSIIERLTLQNENNNSTSNGADQTFKKIHARLQSIPDTKNAVYQNIFCDKIVPCDLIKEEIAELDRLISSNEAVLGPDGKLISRNMSPVNIAHEDGINANSQDNLYCKICKINFSTQKTLKFHMKHKHTENRLVYPCPDCTDTFSNSWSVFRHLFKVHRKSATHIRKLRESIQKKAFTLDISTVENLKAAEAPVNSITEQQRVNQENQAWIDNLERDGDIPRCGGCGKRFERRAALSSHRQTCQLRKSAQNKLNSNLHKKIVTKSSIKDADDSILSEPSAKISKMDKPLEKRIEIKIRRDYIKTSPVNVRTSSPADEDSTMESMEHSDTTNLGFSIGESDCNFVNSLDKSYFNENSYAETVKDYDDANVDGSLERNSSDTNNSIDINEYSNFSHDNDINFDDIKTTCNNENIKNINKAYGQKKENFLTESSFDITEYDDTSEKCLNMDIDNVGNDFCEKTEDSFTENQHELNKYQCDYCNVIFDEKYRLEKHIMRHLIWIKFKCKLCGIKSCNATQYERHMKYQHKKSSCTKKKRNVRSRIRILTKTPLSKFENMDNIDEECTDLNNSIALKDDCKIIMAKLKDNIIADKNDNSKLKGFKPKIVKTIKKKQGLMIKQLREKRKTSISTESSEISISKHTKIPDAQLSMESEDKLIDNPNSKTDVEECLPDSSTFKSRHKKYYETDIPEDDIKKHDQHIASSESYTVRRPVRNRIKHFDKDFEYDSSYLPKIKTDHKENSMVRILSEKSILKRKQFLQNENENEKAVELILSEEVILMNQKEEITQINQKEETRQMNQREETRQMNQKEETRQMNQKEEIKPMISKEIIQQMNWKETAVQKLQGALEVMSLRATSQGKAMMKQKQHTTIRRYTPPFIRTPYRIPSTILETQKLTESFAPIHPLPVSQHGAMKKRIVPLVKTAQLKYLQTSPTPSKTSEKSFSEVVHQKTGTSTSTMQTKILHVTKKTPLITYPMKKKRPVQQQTLPTKVTKALKFDHEALSKSGESNSINEEVSMITKPSHKKNTVVNECEFSENTLSILPTNGKTKSDFVNISLKELKDLQREKNESLNEIRSTSPKRDSVLKNLKDNDEIKISKVNDAKKRSDSVESQKNAQFVEIIDVKQRQSQPSLSKKISIKNLITQKNKNTFPQKVITVSLDDDDDDDIDIIINESETKKLGSSKTPVSELFVD